MLTRRPLLLGLTICFMTLALVGLPVLADELIGTIKSVDVEAKKIVVTPKGGDKDVGVTVNGSTSYENAKGKVHKKFSLDRIKTGGSVEVTYESGVASKIVLKKGSVKKKGE